MDKLVIHFVSGESITIDGDAIFNGHQAQDLKNMCGSILARAEKSTSFKVESEGVCLFLNPARITFIELLSEAN